MNRIQKIFLIGATAILSGFQSLSALDFTLLSDIHVVPGNRNEQELEKAVAEINRNKSKFVILSGDLSNEGSDEQLFTVKRILDKLNKPIYVVPGNHENNWSQSATKTFKDIWGDDRFVFETDSLIFIGINCGPYMKMGDGHVKQEDLIWLDKELSKRCTAGKRVVSINHYPIKPDIDNWQDYLKVLQKYPVILQIGGHYHASQKYKAGDIDALICRALDMNHKQDGYGYTDFRITPDSIFVYDKVLAAPEKQIFAFKANASHPAYQAVADNVSTTMPAKHRIELVYRDSASIFTRVALDKSRIYFGNSLGEAKAVNKTTGKLVWEFRTAASLFSRPAITSKYAIIPTADKRIIWSDKKTGRIIRENPSDGPYVADGVVVGNRLYQGGYNKFECWNTNTANRVWSLNDLHNYCQAAPVVDGNDVIFGAWDTYLRCVDRKTGKLKWKWSNGKTANMLSPGNCVPVVTKDKVIIVAPDRYMTMLDRKTGKQIWRTNFDEKYRVRESLGKSQDGRLVYAKTMDGQLLAVDATATTPTIAFAVDAQLGYEHAPCIVVEKEDVIYLGSRNGILSAVSKSQQKLLWNYRLGNSEFNGFEIDQDGSIYTSLIEGTIWRIRQTK